MLRHPVSYAEGGIPPPSPLRGPRAIHEPSAALPRADSTVPGFESGPDRAPSGRTDEPPHSLEQSAVHVQSTLQAQTRPSPLRHERALTAGTTVRPPVPD